MADNQANDNKPHAFNPPDVPAPPPSYDQVCITPLLPTSRLITLAGYTGVNPARKDNPTDLLEQVAIVYPNIKRGLAAAGATPRDIVQVKHYIVVTTGNAEMDKIDIVDRGWAQMWCDFMDAEAGGHRPPDTVIGVAALAKKEILYECEVWAILNQ